MGRRSNTTVLTSIQTIECVFITTHGRREYFIAAGRGGGRTLRERRRLVGWLVGQLVS